jgi:hypothetical protein
VHIQKSLSPTAGPSYYGYLSGDLEGGRQTRMPWFKRHYGATDYRQAFERFEQMFNSLHGPRDMMMISTGLADDTIIYLSLPHHKLAVAYPGFEPIQPADLPTEATLLIGHQDAFQERFRFPIRD